MSKMNIPLSKNEITEALNLKSMPRNWKRNGITITEWHGTYRFKTGLAICMFAEGLKHFTKRLPNATRVSLFDLVFNVLSAARPDLFVKIYEPSIEEVKKNGSYKQAFEQTV